jgi:glycine/D-amino acid oxidase-like deaminating enzyme
MGTGDRISNVQYRPALPETADVVVAGGGTGGMAVAEALREYSGDSLKVVVVEQQAFLGGHGIFASAQLARTYQGHPELSNFAADTITWYRERGLTSPMPYLFVATTGRQLQRLREQLARVQGWGHDQNGRILGQRDLQNLYPWINGPRVTGALYLPNCCRLDLSAAIDWTTSHSPKTLFALGTTVQAIRAENRRVVQVVTDQGIIATEKVVLASGAWFLQADGLLQGGEIVGDGQKASGLVKVLTRQRFVAPVPPGVLSPNTHVMLIHNTSGAYANIATDSTGAGEAFYGWAGYNNQPCRQPQEKPPVNQDFPPEVYHLMRRLSPLAWGTDQENGPLARQRPMSGTHVAGYYVVPIGSDLPIISSTAIDGFYAIFDLDHLGVMCGIAAGHFLVSRVMYGSDNAGQFSIQRKPAEDRAGIRL